MEVRRVSGNVFDVFLGRQWSDWVRMKVTRHGAFRIDGLKVDHQLRKEISDLLNPYMPIVYGQDQRITLANCLSI